MDPISLGTMFAVSMAASGAGAGVSAFGKLSEGAANQGMYQYQSGVAALNHKIALQNADYERKVGEVKAQEMGMKTRFQMGETKVAQAAGNIDVSRGSAAAVRDSEHELGLHDQATTRANAARRAYGYDVEAAQDTAQMRMYSEAASQSRRAGEISAISSILGGASSVSDKWAQMKYMVG